eukprot:GHVR01033129.1.p1 GENE.GHVR01033129.1~~GHVR01033129.1.p1  ORF type:complete len:160 (+),score=8.30 GHVR01033129.1:2-481(+)
MLFEQLSGCRETCPACKAVCTNTIENHDGDHSVLFHRPQALCGSYLWHKTDHFVIDICSSLVASDCYVVLPDRKVPWKEYRTLGPEYERWSITPDVSVLLYWKWFVCRFQKELENKYKYRFIGLGEIPDGWKNNTKEEVKSVLLKQMGRDDDPSKPLCY